MKYECPHAYSKDNIPYILCRREVEPNPNNQKEISHSACPHQRFCGTKRCTVLTPMWVGCLKNKMDTNTAEVLASKATPKKTSRKKDSKVPELQAESEMAE